MTILQKAIMLALTANALAWANAELQTETHPPPSEETRNIAESEILLSIALRNLRYVDAVERDTALEAELVATISELRTLRAGAESDQERRTLVLAKGTKLARQCLYLIDTGHRMAGRSEDALRDSIPGGHESMFVGRWRKDQVRPPLELELRADGTFSLEGEGKWREFIGGKRIYLEYTTKRFFCTLYLDNDGKLFMRDHDVNEYFIKLDVHEEIEEGGSEHKPGTYFGKSNTTP